MNCPSEISGFGTGILQGSTFHVTEIDDFIPEQECTGATTELIAESSAKIFKAHPEDSPLGQIRFHWHSHVNMETFWSGTDIETIKTFGKRGWMFAAVFNQRGDMKGAVSWRQKNSNPFGGEFLSTEINDNIPVEIQDEGLTDQEIAKLDHALKTKVREKVVQYQYKDYSQWWKDDRQPAARRAIDDSPTPANNYALGTARDLSNQGFAAVEQSDYYRELESTGYFGYGADAEANALGMSKWKYMDTLINGTDKQVDRVTKKLEKLLTEGN
jgi:proteasome lid subunit RPN8/RPN11